MKSDLGTQSRVNLFGVVTQIAAFNQLPPPLFFAVFHLKYMKYHLMAC